MKDGSFSIEHGVLGDQQESMFMNYTLSTHGDALTISIAVHPNFPPDLDTRNEAAVEEFLRQEFEPLPAQGFDIELKAGVESDEDKIGKGAWRARGCQEGENA